MQDEGRVKGRGRGRGRKRGTIMSGKNEEEGRGRTKIRWKKRRGD